MRVPAHIFNAGVVLICCAALPAFAQECAVPECPGIALAVGYTGDLRSNTQGGLETGTAYSHVLSLGADWSSDSLFDAARLSGSASVMYIGGDGISSEYVGDLQGINNIEADAGWRLYEMWTELAFGSRSQTTLRAGVLDMNAEFDTPETTGLFVASPHGIGTDLSQSGSAGPSVWPTTGLGIRAAGAAENGFAWRVGLYDGAPGGKDGNEFSSLKISSEEGALAIGELVYSSEHVNKISLGAWGYSARFERIDAELQPDAEPAKGNHGFYTLIDLPLGSAGDARFDGALRMGTASKEFNPVDRYVGLAFTTSGFSAARPDDAFGVAVAYARLGEPYRAAQEFSGVSTTSAEITWEFNYTTPLTPWLALMPGVQFVQHPGADASLGDAWVVGLRFDVSHGQSWRQTARHETPAGDPVASLE